MSSIIRNNFSRPLPSTLPSPPYTHTAQSKDLATEKSLLRWSSLCQSVSCLGSGLLKDGWPFEALSLIKMESWGFCLIPHLRWFWRDLERQHIIWIRGDREPHHQRLLVISWSGDRDWTNMLPHQATHLEPRQNYWRSEDRFQVVCLIFFFGFKDLTFLLVYPTPNNGSKTEMCLLLTVDLRKTVGVNEIVQWRKDTSYISLMARVQPLGPLVEGELSFDISRHSYTFITYIHVNNHF